MYLSTRTLLACLLALVALFRASMAIPPCRNVVGVRPKDCRYGVIEYCNTYICARGHGASCSTLPNSPSRCGEGYFCLCGQCQGCSLKTLSDCFYKTTNCISH